MEKPQLEKIIEKLEKLDIREWKTVDNSFFDGMHLTVSIQGLIFQLVRYRHNDFSFYIVNEERSIKIEYHDKKLNYFGEKLFKAFEEYKQKKLPEQEKEFEKRLYQFISE